MYLKIIIHKFDKLKTYSKTCILHHDVQKNIHKKLPTWNTTGSTVRRKVKEY